MNLLHRLLGAPAPAPTTPNHREEPLTVQNTAPAPDAAPATEPAPAAPVRFTDLPCAGAALELLRQAAAGLGQASLGKSNGLSAASTAMGHLAQILETGVDPRKPSRSYPPDIVEAHRALRGAFSMSDLEAMDTEERRIRVRYADPESRRQLMRRYEDVFGASALSDPVVMCVRLRRHDEAEAERKRREEEESRQREADRLARIAAARATLDEAKLQHAGLNDAEALQLAGLITRGKGGA